MLNMTLSCKEPPMRSFSRENAVKEEEDDTKTGEKNIRIIHPQEGNYSSQVKRFTFYCTQQDGVAKILHGGKDETPLSIMMYESMLYSTLGIKSN